MMSWVKLDDQWMDHPKIVRAGRDARDMWLASITWCSKHLTDGYFPKELLPSLAVMAGVDVANCQTFANTLLHVCLWELHDDQYYIHDYLDYNPTKEQAMATRAARSVAGKAGGEAKASKMASKTVAKSWQKSAPSPSPSPLKDSQVVVVEEPQIPEPEAWASEPEPATATSPVPAIRPERAAENLLLKAGRMAAIPPGQMQRIEQVHGMIDRYGPGQVENALVESFRKWISTPKKNGGGTYSPLNFGWVDWAQESLMNVQADIKPAYRPNMSKDELMRYLGVKPE